jgi:hypothetical protein
MCLAAVADERTRPDIRTGKRSVTRSCRFACSFSRPDDLTDADYAEMGEAGPIVRELRQQKNKLVVFIYDVSGSMNQDKMIRRARQTAANIVRRGTFPGDAVSLYTFGAGYNHQNFKITRGADRPEVVEKLPKETGEGAGTNIRKPHHDALREIDKQPERPAAIVVLTDSFNDEPKPDDPKYADYRKYYTPGGMLTKYPKTGENSDYERLLAKWVQSGKVKQYGVGINFAENGRPIERLPQAAPPPVEVAATPAPTVPTAAPEKPNNTLWIVLAGIGAAAVGGFFLAPLFKTASLRITGGPSGAKDFDSYRRGRRKLFAGCLFAARCCTNGCRDSCARWTDGNRSAECAVRESGPGSRRNVARLSHRFHRRQPNHRPACLSQWIAARSRNADGFW